MKAFFVTIMILLLILTGICGVSWGIRDCLYNVRIGQYLKLADDASLPTLKEDFLLKYKEAVGKHIIRNEARYIFKQERLTKEAQFKNLDSLIKRLTDIKMMQPDSLAYQQGMQQITGQEFDHTMAEIDGVFFDCYIRDYFMSRYAIKEATITLGVFVVLIGIGLLVTLD